MKQHLYPMSELISRVVINKQAAAELLKKARYATIKIKGNNDVKKERS